MVARCADKPGMGRELETLREQLDAGEGTDSLEAFERMFGLYLHVRRAEFVGQLDALQERIDHLEHTLRGAPVRA